MITVYTYIVIAATAIGCSALFGMENNNSCAIVQYGPQFKYDIERNLRNDHDEQRVNQIATSLAKRINNENPFSHFVDRFKKSLPVADLSRYVTSFEESLCSDTIELDVFRIGGFGFTWAKFSYENKHKDFCSLCERMLFATKSVDGSVSKVKREKLEFLFNKVLDSFCTHNPGKKDSDYTYRSMNAYQCAEHIGSDTYKKLFASVEKKSNEPGKSTRGNSAQETTHVLGLELDDTNSNQVGEKRIEFTLTCGHGSNPCSHRKLCEEIQKFNEALVYELKDKNLSDSHDYKVQAPVALEYAADMCSLDIVKKCKETIDVTLSGEFAKIAESILADKHNWAYSHQAKTDYLFEEVLKDFESRGNKRADYTCKGKNAYEFAKSIYACEHMNEFAEPLSKQEVSDSKRSFDTEMQQFEKELQELHLDEFGQKETIMMRLMKTLDQKWSVNVLKKVDFAIITGISLLGRKEIYEIILFDPSLGITCSDDNTQNAFCLREKASYLFDRLLTVFESMSKGDGRTRRDYSHAQVGNAQACAMHIHSKKHIQEFSLDGESEEDVCDQSRQQHNNTIVEKANDEQKEQQPKKQPSFWSAWSWKRYATTTVAAFAIAAVAAYAFFKAKK